MKWEEGIAGAPTFAPGDVFVSSETGPVQWRTPDGTLKAVLVSRVPGTTSEGMAFDATGNRGRRRKPPSTSG